ncbi:ubiquitin domain-containing protein [Aspergillus clavatus NRRL 1]|uniref:Ubiquitin domain protein, putative n=1 Tax=Aspergillus clavatus (strain ATCC 1007 / CBS 513.65 / DSM 816 / NCTC 3887 / NRRL 1 / QM 1276 / 107) TaxID=344612 RepID=A1CQ13_ASPCL|nr:ubiquitin domain protein, putative [Aspergillus clavatus NRRL 1]EAW07734.1 ubiquitin domain protein, putative [Aspergillus clavatus NRRL 1]
MVSLAMMIDSLHPPPGALLTVGSCLSFLSRDHGNPSSHTTQAVTGEHRADASSSGLRSTSNAITSSNYPSTSLARATSRSDRRASTPVPQLALSEHFNAPIRPHVWYSKRRTWSRTQLDQERKEFFETRVTGRSEVWAALATSISLMHADDLTTAQSIIDAAGVTVPTGDLCQGCYDEQGVLYRLPRCIVSDPENMVRDDSASRRGDVYNDNDFDTDDAKLSLDEASGDELICGESRHRRDEKGKMSERDLIRVKARLSDGSGSDVVVSVGAAQSVGLIARRVQHEAGIPATHRVRIAYLGRMLKENASLMDQGWKAGNIINALVVAKPPRS